MSSVITSWHSDPVAFYTLPQPLFLDVAEPPKITDLEPPAGEVLDNLRPSAKSADAIAAIGLAVGLGIMLLRRKK
jgi:hypothetical protein